MLHVDIQWGNGLRKPAFILCTAVLAKAPEGEVAQVNQEFCLSDAVKN